MRRQQPDIIYFACDPVEGLIKIGCSSNWERRLRNLSSELGRKLEPVGLLAGSILTEHRIHRRLANLRIRGEWFREDRAIYDLIESVDSGADKSGLYGRRIR